jgi:methionine-rich copper-binding protein CopC
VKSALALVLVVAAAGILTGEARAHALLVRSNPSDGAMVRVAPSQIALTFGEALSPKVVSLVVVDGRGKAVRVTPHLAASSVLVGSLPRLRRGSYAVTWQVMSRDDGHLTSGTMVFGVGRSAAAASTRTKAPATPPADALLHWLAFAFDALLLGGLAVSVAVLRPVAMRVGSQVRAADRGVLILAVSGALGASLCQFVLIGRSAAGVRGMSLPAAMRVVASTRWGALGMVEIGLLLILGFAAIGLRARPAVCSRPSCSLCSPPSQRRPSRSMRFAVTPPPAAVLRPWRPRRSIS